MDNSFRVWVGPRTTDERNYLINKGLLAEDNDGEFRELPTVIYESSEDESFQDKSYNIPFVGVENVGDLQDQSIETFDDKENVQPPNSSMIMPTKAHDVTDKQNNTSVIVQDAQTEIIVQSKDVDVKEDNSFLNVVTTRMETMSCQEVSKTKDCTNMSLNVTIGTESLFSQEPDKMDGHISLSTSTIGLEVFNAQEVFEKEDYRNLNITTGIERLYSEEATVGKDDANLSITTGFDVLISAEDYTNLNVTVGTEKLFSEEQNGMQGHSNLNVTTWVGASQEVSEKDHSTLNVTSGFEILYSDEMTDEKDAAILNGSIPHTVQNSNEKEDYVSTSLNITTGIERLYSQEGSTEDNENNYAIDLSASGEFDITQDDELKVESEMSTSGVNNLSFTIAHHEDSYESMGTSCSTGGMDDTMSAIEKMLALAEEAELNEQTNLTSCNQTPESCEKDNKGNLSIVSAKSFDTPQPKLIKSAHKKERTLDSPNISSFAKTPDSRYSAMANKGSVSASSVKFPRTPKSREIKSARKTAIEPMTASPNLLSFSATTPELLFASEKNGSLSVYSVKKLQTLKSRDATPIRTLNETYVSPLISLKTPKSSSAKEKKGSASASSVKRIHLLKSRETIRAEKSTSSLNSKFESPNLITLSATSPELLFTDEKNGEISVHSGTHNETPNSREAQSSKNSSDNLINFSPYKAKRLLDLKKKGKLFSPSPPRPPPNAKHPRVIQKLVEESNEEPNPAELLKGLFPQIYKTTSPKEKLSFQNKMYADVNSPVREYIYGRATPSSLLKSRNMPLKDEGVNSARTPRPVMASTPRNCLGTVDGNADSRSLSVEKKVSLEVHSKDHVATPIPQLTAGVNKFKVTQFKGSSKQRIENQDPSLLTSATKEMALRHTGLRNESGNESLLSGTPLKKQFIPFLTPPVTSVD